MNRAARRLAVMLLFSCGTLTGAGAFEPTGHTLADVLFAFLHAPPRASLTYDRAEVAGDTVTVHQVDVAPQDTGEHTRFAADRIVVSGDDDGKDGWMEFDRLEISGGTVTSKDFAMTLGTMEARDLSWPIVSDAAAPPFRPDRHSRFRVSGLTLATGAGLLLPVAEIAIESTDFLRKIAKRSTLTVTGVDVVAANLPAGELRDGFAALGYSSARFGGVIEWVYDEARQTLAMPRTSFGADNVGTLTIGIELGGWSRELFEALAEYLTTDDAETDAQFMARAQTTTVNAISIEFDDRSIVERLLTAEADRAGVSREDLITSQITTLSGLLATLRNRAFHDMVVAQARAFLRDPGMLTIRASPDAPVPIAQLIGLAAIAPQAVPDMLGVTVSATR